MLGLWKHFYTCVLDAYGYCWIPVFLEMTELLVSESEHQANLHASMS